MAALKKRRGPASLLPLPKEEGALSRIQAVVGPRPLNQEVAALANPTVVPVALPALQACIVCTYEPCTASVLARGAEPVRNVPTSILG